MRSSPVGSIQTHRLCGDDDPDYDPMNANVRAAYGDFRSRLRFDALRDALSARGCVLVPVTRPEWDVLEYTHQRTRASVLVTTATARVGLDEGDIWRIALSIAAPYASTSAQA
jgi:hypothetical protein